MSKAAWNARFQKSARYVRRGDWAGFYRTVLQYAAWKLSFLPLGSLYHSLIRSMPARWQSRREAAFWGSVETDRARQVSWDSIECLGRMAVRQMTGGRWEQLMDAVIHTMTPPDRLHLRGLALGCGDMAGEKWYFTHPALPFEGVDAYDISAEVIQRARLLTDSLKLNVQYHVEDVNEVRLPPETYDLAVVAHSLHHFREIDHIVDQVNRSLKPGGLFVVWEYVGPRFQQFTRRQLDQATLVLQSLPERYRRELDGSIRKQAVSQPLFSISPDEAIRSDLILPALKRMNIVYQYNWAGLLFPLLRGGMAANFDQNDAEDRHIIEALFELDRLLCRLGCVEPNYTITIAGRSAGAAAS
jgi:SAM-dependent methyltransferase